MRVLIDTNIILDALIGRQPYFDNADKIIKLTVCGQNNTWLSGRPFYLKYLLYSPKRYVCQ